MNKEYLCNRIASNMEAISKAYNMRNKTLYKQCLYSLELDLKEYYDRIKETHPSETSLIKLYEKLWEFK